MKRLPVFLLTLLVIASTTWVAGCGPEATSPSVDTSNYTDRDETVDFNDEIGGFNLQDERPGFGDPQLLSEFAEDAAYNDVFASDDDVLDEDRRHRKRYFLMITWGNLHRDSSIVHPTDWTGSLSISSGAIVLKRIIRFEENDEILPRTQRELLEWRSVTRPHYDGILVRIVPQPSETSVDAEVSDVMIKFDTEPLSVEFPVSALPGLHRVVTLEDGNAVAFTSVEITPNDCPHGPMRGIWANHPERQGGFFLGKWATSDGRIAGHIRGIYGTNDEGKKVMFGKMIDLNGRFEGIVRGEWGRDPNTGHGGWYAARWVDRNLGIKGGIKGHWERSAHCNGGFFRGAWAVNCN